MILEKGFVIRNRRRSCLGGPGKSFKIELLGNGISGIMRRNQPVIMSHFFFHLGSSTESPEYADVSTSTEPR